MPLVLGDAGCEYDIKKIGGNDEVRTRLSAAGLRGNDQYKRRKQ